MNTEAFNTIDDADGSTNIELRFGSSATRILYDISSSQFDFNDNVNITGQMSGASLSVGGGDVTISTAGAAVFNENSADVDFRIEGNGEPNLFFADAGNDRVGIGTNAPDTAFSVVGTISGSALSFGGGQFTVAADGTSIFNQFGTATNFRIESDNEVNMFFVDGANDRIGINTSNPFSTLHLSGSLSTSILSVTGSVTLNANNHTVLATTDTTQTITLPAASSSTIGKELYIVKTGVGTVTVSAAGADTINGSSSKSLTTQYSSLRIVGESSSSWVGSVLSAP